MPQVAVTLIVTGSALMALIILVVAIRSGQLVARWDRSSTFIVLVAWLLLASSVYTQMSGGTQTFVNAFGDTTAIPDPRSGQIAQLAGLAICGLGFVTFMVGLAQRSAIFTPMVLAALLVLLTDLSSSLAGASTPGNPRIIGLIALFLGASVLPRGGGARLGVAAVALSVSIASGLLLLFDYAAVFRYCRTDKCGPLGTLFFGVTTGENVLGMILAAALPGVFLAFRGRVRWVLGLYVISVIYLCGSRTALLAALIIAVVVLFTQLNSTRPSSVWATLVAAATAVSGLLVGLLLPYLPLSPDSFTNRTYLWQLAIGELGSSEVWGFGGLHWSDQTSNGVISRDQAYSVHNQWLDIRYTAGLVGVALFVMLLILTYRKTARGYAAAGTLMLLPVILTGFFERTWAFGVLDVFGWMAAATLLSFEPAEDPIVRDLTSGSADRMRRLAPTQYRQRVRAKVVRPGPALNKFAGVDGLDAACQSATPSPPRPRGRRL